MMRQWEYDTFFLPHDSRSEQKQKIVPRAVLQSRNRASFGACRRWMSSLSGATTYPDTASSGSQSQWNHISIWGTGMGRGTFCSRAWCHRRRVRCLWRYDACCVLDSTKQYKVHWQEWWSNIQPEKESCIDYEPWSDPSTPLSVDWFQIQKYWPTTHQSGRQPKNWGIWRWSGKSLYPIWVYKDVQLYSGFWNIPESQWKEAA